MSETGSIHATKRVLLAALLATTLLLPLAGCAANEGSEESVSTSSDLGISVDSDVAYDEEAQETQRAAMPQVEPTADGDVANVDDSQRLIIRNLGLRLEVDSVSDSIAEIRDLVASANGSITDLQVTTDDYGPVYRYEGALSDGTALSAYVTIRVPVGDANDFTESTRSLGEVLREAEDESDVTQQHIDLSARLRNLQALEEQLRSFFDQAADVEDLLAVQSELERVRGEVESLQDRISFLERQASMATITVELVEPSAVVRPSGNDWGFVDAITTGIRAFVNTINVLIVILLGALPLIAIGFVIFVLIRSRIRKRGPRTTDAGATNYNATPPPPTDSNEQ
ncbi:MAG: DUF4349 domain-containing protein [Actinomycetota bacterium]|jgi:hypothetical protein|nr:DUF4349 domain-containing protein [Actinomycetota bacterium]